MLSALSYNSGRSHASLWVDRMTKWFIGRWCINPGGKLSFCPCGTVAFAMSGEPEAVAQARLRKGGFYTSCTLNPFTKTLWPMESLSR